MVVQNKILPRIGNSFHLDMLTQREKVAECSSTKKMTDDNEGCITKGHCYYTCYVLSVWVHFFKLWYHTDNEKVEKQKRLKCDERKIPTQSDEKWSNLLVLDLDI